MAKKNSSKTVFSDILKSGKGISNTQKAREFYRRRAREVARSRTAPNKLIKEAKAKNNLKATVKGKLMIGNMYMFQYAAKLEETLPYYDEFPLVFPFKPLADGFIGINMHYLSPKYRAILMDNLYPLMNNQKMDESTRLRLRYDLLNGAKKYKYFKPCIHRYLTSHVQSRFIQVPIEEWDIALFLPTERFIGESRRKVWAESKGQF